MALAFLQLVDDTDGKYRFLIDTGTSSLFEFVIGKSVTDKNGVRFVDEIQKRSGLRKAASVNPLRTGTEQSFDATLFENDQRFLQLFTYQSKDRLGATFSEVVELKPKLFDRKRFDDLPDIKIPKYYSMSASYQVPGRVSQAFGESNMSEAMFFAALMPMLTKILPIAGNLLGGLGGGGAAGGGLGGIIGNILPMLSGLLGGGGGNSGGGASPGGGTNTPAQGINLAELLKPETIQAVKGLIEQFAQKGKMAQGKSLTADSNPVASPLLLHLSPVIAPILEKLVSPETITSIGSNPQKLYAAIADGIAHLPVKDIITIKKLLVQTTPAEYVQTKSDVNYSQPMFWQALLSMLTPDMVNAIGGQANNLMKTAQEGILNIKKEQGQFLKDMMPNAAINQPVIKDMIGAISQYNLLTHQPQTQQPGQQQAIAQSIGAFTNALCQMVPVIEKSLSNDSVIDDAQEKTKELAEKIQNQFMKLQEDLKKKMLRSMKEKIEEQIDQINIQSLSLQFSSRTRNDDGLAIFNCAGVRKKSPQVKAVAHAMRNLLPVAFVNELQRTAGAMKTSGKQRYNGYKSNDPAVSLMLQKIDDARQTVHQTISFKHDGRFTLHITGAKTIDVQGTKKVVYVAEKGIRFAVTIQSQKKEAVTIPQCIIQVQIKDAEEKNILADKKFRLTNVTTGVVQDSLFFEPEILKELPANTDLLVCFTLAWKDKSDMVKGTRIAHSIIITKGYLFNGLSSVIQPGIPLNNITDHRDYWHKIWESKNPGERKRTKIDCKYYMQYEIAAPKNSHIQTKTLLKKGKEVSESEYEADDDFIKIKSGLQLSPVALNNLIPKISKYPALTERQLDAVKDSSAKKLIDSKGIGHVEFKSRRGETCMLWVYPEVDLVEISFKKPHAINPYGNVLDLTEEKAVFIKPASLHFIGTKN